MSVFIKHVISGHSFILLPQEYGLDIFIGHTFLLLTQEYGHKLWVRIVTSIDDHGTKVAQNPGHIQFINSINDDQHEKVVSCNNITNHILQKGDSDIVWELKGITEHEETLINITLVANGFGKFSRLNER